METSELFLPLLVLGIMLFMLILGIFNRVIAKLGLRNFYRHRGHAIISIAGLLVGTSIICASMVVGDSIEYYIVEETYNELQYVDILIEENSGQPFDYSIFTALEEDAELDELTDGISPILVQSATVRHLGTGQFEPEASIIGFDPDIDSAFGDFILDDSAKTPISGEGLEEYDAMVNRELADSLGATEGDVLSLTFSVGSYFDFQNYSMKTILGYQNITIKHILADEAKALYSPGAGMATGASNIFMNLGSVQSIFNQSGLISHIKVSNNGGIEDGADNSDSTIAATLSPLEGLIYSSSESHTIYTPNTTAVQLLHTNITMNSAAIYVNDLLMVPANYTLDAETGTVVFSAPLQFFSNVQASYEFSYFIEVTPIKEEGLDAAKMINDLISMFLTIFGSFAIIAGVILIINIFTMLAEERKSELGMARAVGMKRRHLMQSFLFEGLAYGIIASALGTLLGVGVGAVLIFMVNNLIEFIDVQLPLHFQLFSLVSAFSLGFIITFGTILLTSWKISKLNIINAIRGIEDSTHSRKKALVPMLGGMLAVLSAVIYLLYPEELVTKLIAPSGFLTGIIMILWRWIGNRAAITSASLGVFIWTYYAIKTYFGDMDSNSMDFLFVFSGVIIVLSIVLLIMYNSGPLIMAITGTLGRVRKWRPTIMTAVSYPLTKKFRTGMSVGMFALVVYMIVMLSVFSNMFVIDVDDETRKQGGGFDIIADCQYPIQDLFNATDPSTGEIISPTTLQNNISAMTNIQWTYSPRINNTDAKAAMDFGGMEMYMFAGIQVLGIDETFYTDSSFEFSNTLEEDTPPQVVWESITKPGSVNVVVSSTYSLLMGIKPGHNVTLENIQGATSKKFTVVGVLDNSIEQLTGLFMSKENLYATFPAHMMIPDLNKNIYMFNVSSDNVKETSEAFEREYAAFGMNCIIIRDVAEQTLDTTTSIFVLFELYLDMGLVVGVAGLGIITIRSVVERTPEIGILRSIGFKRKNVRNAFLIEILFIATMGVVIGVVTGVMISYEIFNVMMAQYGGDVEFVIPWFKIAYITAIAYAATIICTIIPAHNASKISPAEALHYVG